MIKRLKQLRNVWFAGIIALLLLSFTQQMGGFAFFWMFFWTILSFGFALYLVLDQIRCPTCGVQLLSRKSIQSPDNCYNCGRNLNGKKPSGQDVAEQLIERYGDERAARTDWTPLQTASANFDNFKLHIASNGRISFKPTFGALSFGGIFIVFGILFYTIDYLIMQNTFWMSFMGLISLLFVGLGLFLLHQSWQPIRVDRHAGLFVLGWDKEKAVPLRNIKALQLLSRKVSSNRHHYENYQINLVLSGGERKNIVYYYKRKKAISDAEQLAEQLGLKLWNGIDR